MKARFSIAMLAALTLAALLLTSGSVADLLHDDAKLNLWKFFNPIMRELAVKPEVLALEKPFDIVEHEDLHSEAGFEEGQGLSRELKRLAG